MNFYQQYLRVWIILLAACLLLLLGCAQTDATTDEGALPEVDAETGQDAPGTGSEETAQPETAASTISEPVDLSTGLIAPEDLHYLGAFRLPVTGDEYGWSYSGYAMTFYPGGDPGGPDDGFPGSLYVLGHDHAQTVAEISIPAPVISASKDPGQLHVANMLQPFQDITGGIFGELEIPRAGLAYLPPLGSQTTGKLYFCWGQHFQFEPEPSHGWSELDLSAPNPVGPWHVAEYTNYITNDYLLEIPEAWAAAYTPGLRLATGRFRDGSWGGLGPALLALGPWNEGNPPPSNSSLQQVTPLLLYGEPQPGNPEIIVTEDRRMDVYSEPDEWSGGAWLTAGDGAVDGVSAVIFVGTKAIGKSWYGFSNGVEYPTSGDPDEEYPEVPAWPHDERGWWSEDISAMILFYDPSELGAVAQSKLQTWQPQPYASLVLDEFLFDAGFDYERAKRYLLGAAAFDRENGLLYIVERMADEEERSLMHVFRLET